MRQWDPYKHDVFDESKRKKKKSKYQQDKKTRWTEALFTKMIL